MAPPVSSLYLLLVLHVCSGKWFLLRLQYVTIEAMKNVLAKVNVWL